MPFKATSLQDAVSFKVMRTAQLQRTERWAAWSGPKMLRAPGEHQRDRPDPGCIKQLKITWEFLQ